MPVSSVNLVDLECRFADDLPFAIGVIDNQELANVIAIDWRLVSLIEPRTNLIRINRNIEVIELDINVTRVVNFFSPFGVPFQGCTTARLKIFGVVREISIQIFLHPGIFPPLHHLPNFWLGGFGNKSWWKSLLLGGRLRRNQTNGFCRCRAYVAI